MTAENVGRQLRGVRRSLASMRPRPMTAENLERDVQGRRAADASMRPRPMTAENMGEDQLKSIQDMVLQ